MYGPRGAEPRYAATNVATGLAYGSADQPVAQVEVSANCDNPSFPLCAPFPQGVGGVGGPGGAGAGSIKGTATWVPTTLETAPPGAIFFGTFDPHDSYYAVTITDGSTWLIPTTTGHYGTKLAPGVQIQITVAP